jgi:hypothetical protein
VWVRLTHDEGDSESFELDGQRSVEWYPSLEDPRAWERYGQANGDTLDCPSNGGSLVFLNVFLTDDLRQKRGEHAESARAAKGASRPS